MGNQSVTIDKPYSDNYVTIDYYGNVTAKNASGGQKTYNLTTKNQYTKMVQSGNYVGYADASGKYSTTSAGKYEDQTWNDVTLTVTTTGSSTSTEEPTTEAPATYKATLSTTNAQTKIASGSQSATGNNGSVTLTAGQTVTVTPGASNGKCEFDELGQYKVSARCQELVIDSPQAKQWATNLIKAFSKNRSEQ